MTPEQNPIVNVIHPESCCFDKRLFFCDTPLNICCFLSIVVTPSSLLTCFCAHKSLTPSQSIHDINFARVTGRKGVGGGGGGNQSPE